MLCCWLFVVDTDKRHKGEVVNSPLLLSVRDSAAEFPSVDHLSVCDADNWSLQSSLPCIDNDDDPGCSCARTGYMLPVERWSGKRKRHNETVGSKHMKTSKPMWVDGLGHDADESHSRLSETQLHVDAGPAPATGQVDTPSPTKSTASSSAASSPMKLPNKRVPATKAQPPPSSELSTVSHSSSRKPLSSETDTSLKTHPPDADSGKRTHPFVTESGSKTCLTSVDSSTKTCLSVTEAGTRARPSAAVAKSSSSSSAMSPTSAAVSSIVGMSPPATPVMPEPHMTPGRKHTKQKGRGQRNPDSLPCKGNNRSFTFDDFSGNLLYICCLPATTDCRRFCHLCLLFFLILYGSPAMSLT